MAVITPFGLFIFKRLPFGLKNARMTFQRFMDRVLAGLPFTLVYLDNILVANPDWRSQQALFDKCWSASGTMGWCSTWINVSFSSQR